MYLLISSIYRPLLQCNIHLRVILTNYNGAIASSIVCNIAFCLLLIDLIRRFWHSDFKCNPSISDLTSWIVSFEKRWTHYFMLQLYYANSKQSKQPNNIHFLSFRQSRNILRLIAFSEIFLMPMTVVYLFTGRTWLVVPLVYYRFLGLRYSSRRNPYTRAVFYELRLALEQTANVIKDSSIRH